LAEVLLKMAPIDGTTFILGQAPNSEKNEAFWAEVQKEIKSSSDDLPGIANLNKRALSGLSNLFEEMITGDLLRENLRVQLAELR
jgi:hypothetical protein